MTILAKNNSGRPKIENFKTWLEAKPYWEKFLWSLHFEKDELDKTDIKECYKCLLEDATEATVDRKHIVFPTLDLENSEAPRTKATLDKIENLQNVNAVSDDCVIEFSKNLTIIYGDNGTGKSGVGRLLSNACRSRKPRQLLTNARKATYPKPTPSADFHITDDSGAKLIGYKLGDNHQSLKTFSVFDNESALTHLNHGNALEFIPSKLEIFDRVFRSIEALEEMLRMDIKKMECADPCKDLFNGQSNVTNFISNLSNKTTDEEIEDSLRFTKADKKDLRVKEAEYEEKLKLDITAQKARLQEECRDLGVFQTTLSKKHSTLSINLATKINDVLKLIREKKEIADKLSVKNFDFTALKNVGSPEWKSLIIAAQILHAKETASSNGFEPNYCMLCRQPLTDKEKTLFGEYWEFLRSTAETELATARQTLNAYLADLIRIDQQWPSFSTTEAAVKILERDMANDLKKIKGDFDNFRIQLQKWITNIRTEKDVSFDDLQIKLDPVATLISLKQKQGGDLVDPAPQILTLKKQIACLKQKRQASNLIPKIKNYTEWLRWDKVFGSINLPTVRGNITRKKSDLMEDLVISEYVNTFNTETKRLNCNFGLKIESRGSHSATIKVLRLEFARDHNPSDILSEGEQTVSALADFLTEARLSKCNNGVIFDDPVTSLDHARRDTIAKRLVEESKERQVIVLTHDIVFLLELEHYAEREIVEWKSLSMRKVADSPGIIKPELPWIALKVKSRVGHLRNRIQTLKKDELGDPDKYRAEVKLWYELLRESWERAVEERLFKGVVQRFNVSVQTQKLAKVEITNTLVKEITDGMSDTSKWLHDTGQGVNTAPPTNTKLEEDLQKLDDFISKCRAE